jgi:hypothetical protein
MLPASAIFAASAAAECVFSVLKKILDDEKEDAKDDCIQAAMYCRLRDGLY